MVAGLAQRGVERPYTHQAEAFDAIRNRRDTVVVTPTASGKSLCYSLPILQAIAED
ncbi:MAG: DEAD/DEAH box helicase, partial [Chloroflexi bacterium]|nr:DEAD/DEAH box helicase [Chloroflexota bacterium]